MKGYLSHILSYTFLSVSCVDELYTLSFVHFPFHCCEFDMQKSKLEGAGIKMHPRIPKLLSGSLRNETRSVETVMSIMQRKWNDFSLSHITHYYPSHLTKSENTLKKRDYFTVESSRRHTMVRRRIWDNEKKINDTVLDTQQLDSDSDSYVTIDYWVTESEKLRRRKFSFENWSHSRQKGVKQQGTTSREAFRHNSTERIDIEESTAFRWIPSLNHTWLTE